MLWIYATSQRCRLGWRTIAPIVVVAAAKVGGIYANNVAPVDFLQDNLVIQNNILAAAHENDVQRFSFSVLPAFIQSLLISLFERTACSRALEPTNEWYAIVKIAGINCRLQK